MTKYSFSSVPWILILILDLKMERRPQYFNDKNHNLWKKFRFFVKTELVFLIQNNLVCIYFGLKHNLFKIWMKSVHLILRHTTTMTETTYRQTYFLKFAFPGPLNGNFHRKLNITFVYDHNNVSAQSIDGKVKRFKKWWVRSLTQTTNFLVN